MGGGHAFRIRKLVYADDRYNDNFHFSLSKFFKDFHVKERKVRVLSKNLQQSVPYAQNEIRRETKFKMAAIANL